MSIRPRERFELPFSTGLAIFDVENEYEIDPQDFLSMGKSSPFTGCKVYGKCLATINSKGEAVCLREQT